MNVRGVATDVILLLVFNGPTLQHSQVTSTYYIEEGMDKVIKLRAIFFLPLNPCIVAVYLKC